MGIELKDVTKKYGKKTILKNISIKMEGVGLVFILGASGSGKSTLLNIIASFDKQYDGNVVVKWGKRNETIEAKKDKKNSLLKEYYDFIFQDYNLINSLTVEDNIKLSVDLSSASFDSEKYEEILNKLGIKELEKRNVRDLSGGEKQRTAIARAILRNSPFILADEPTGNLDSQNGSTIFELLKDMADTKLVLVVTHNEEAAKKYGDRIIRISDGMVVEDTGQLRKTAEETNCAAVQKEKSAVSKWIWKCVGENLRFRKKKLLPMFVILCLCLLCFGVVLGLRGGLNKLVTELTYKTMEGDRYEFRTDGELLSPEAVEWLETEELIETSMIYDTDSIGLAEPTDIKKTPDCIVIDELEVFEGRYTLAEGKFPNAGEVLLSPNAAMELFGTTSCVGKIIVLERMGILSSLLTEEDSTERTGRFIVSGVVATVNDINGAIYVLKSDIETMLIKELYSPYFGVMSIKENNEQTHYYLEMVDKTHQSNIEILSGRLPENDNEIAIDVTGAKNILLEKGILETEDSEINEKQLEQLLDRKYEMYYQRIFLTDVTVVGVVKGNTDSIVNMAYVNRTIEKEELKYLTRFAMLYLNDISEEALEELEEKAVRYGAKYGLGRRRADWAGTVLNFIEIMTYIMAAVTVIMLVVTLCVVFYATKINIMDRTYEIGVIKSLGAGKKFVFQIFFNEVILLGGSASIVAGILLLLLKCTGVIQMYGVQLLEIGFLQLVILLIAGVMVVMVSSLAEILKITRIPIVQAIGEKHF